MYKDNFSSLEQRVINFAMTSGVTYLFTHNCNILSQTDEKKAKIVDIKHAQNKRQI